MLVGVYMSVFKLFMMGVVFICMAQSSVAGKDNAYYELDPAFVVNYGDPNGRLKYLKVDVALRLQNPDQKDKIDDYLAEIRHIMVMKLSALDEKRVLEPTAQEEIRQEALEEIKNYFIEEKLPAYVTDLLFNVFLVQN